MRSSAQRQDAAAELYERLAAYGKTDWYPFHMPGHKRNGEVFCFENPFSMDITEIDGFDNLHHPTGILKTAMERAAGIYGSEKTYYLVNGSSCGILAAISACVSQGGRILMARNCHKSVYHSLFLRGLKPAYLCPPALLGWGMCGSVAPEEIRKGLEENPDAEAVLIPSPTYEGICSDIGRIAQIVHSYGIPLIVDAAHGAHFAFGGKEKERYFPESALEQGADLVIESLHKTLPSLTQTAVLHKKSFLVDEGRLEWYLQIFQSSSPSYVLMASSDSCISYMAGSAGQAAMRLYERRLEQLRKRIKDLRHVVLFDGEGTGQKEKNPLYDRSKLVLRADGLSGPELYDRLRREYHLQPEMCTETYVILMTSPADREEGFHRLEEALVDTDSKIRSDGGQLFHPAVFPEPCPVYTMAETEGMKRETVPAARAEGRIAAESAYLYPPGIPVFVPGERITGRILEILEIYREHHLEIQGLKDPEGQMIQVLAES